MGEASYSPPDPIHLAGVIYIDLRYRAKGLSPRAVACDGGERGISTMKLSEVTCEECLAWLADWTVQRRTELSAARWGPREQKYIKWSFDQAKTIQENVLEACIDLMQRRNLRVPMIVMSVHDLGRLVQELGPMRIRISDADGLEIATPAGRCKVVTGPAVYPGEAVLYHEAYDEPRAR